MWEVPKKIPAPVTFGFQGYMQTRDKRHQKALQNAAALEAKLSLSFEKLLGTEKDIKNAYTQYIALANDFIKATEKINQFATITKDHRGALIEARIKRLESLHGSSDLHMSTDKIKKTNENLHKLEKEHEKFTKVHAQSTKDFIKKHQDAIALREQIIDRMFDPKTTKSHKQQLKHMEARISNFYDLTELFKTKIDTGDLDSVKALFPYVQDKLLPDFYHQRLETLSALDKEEIQTRMPIFKFFYESSDTYRLALNTSEYALKLEESLSERPKPSI